MTSLGQEDKKLYMSYLLRGKYDPWAYVKRVYACIGNFLSCPPLVPSCCGVHNPLKCRQHKGFKAPGFLIRAWTSHQKGGFWTDLVHGKWGVLSACPRDDELSWILDQGHEVGKLHTQRTSGTPSKDLFGGSCSPQSPYQH